MRLLFSAILPSTPNFHYSHHPAGTEGEIAHLICIRLKPVLGTLTAYCVLVCVLRRTAGRLDSSVARAEVLVSKGLTLDGKAWDYARARTHFKISVAIRGVNVFNLPMRGRRAYFSRSWEGLTMRENGSRQNCQGFLACVLHRQSSRWRGRKNTEGRNGFSMGGCRPWRKDFSPANLALCKSTASFIDDSLLVFRP